MTAVGNVVLDGSFVGTPLVGGEASFPNGVSVGQFALTPSPKPYGSLSPAQTTSIDSPSSFVALSGVGTTVKQANTFYLRTDADVVVRITQLDGASPTPAPSSPQLISVKGLLVIEASNARAVVLVEVKGTARVEWFSSGDT